MSEFTTLRSQISQWTLEQDDRTFQHLETLSQSILNRFETLSSDLREVEHSARSSHVMVNNAFSKFMRLSDNKFTEQVLSQVKYKKMNSTVEENSSNIESAGAKDDGMSVIQRYQVALSIGIELLKIADQAQNPDDILLEERDDRSISVFSQMTSSGTVAKSVKLPHMFGTKSFQSEQFLGLIEGFDEPQSPNQQNQSPASESPQSRSASNFQQQGQNSNQQQQNSNQQQQNSNQQQQNQSKVQAPNPTSTSQPNNKIIVNKNAPPPPPPPPPPPKLAMPGQSQSQQPKKAQNVQQTQQQTQQNAQPQDNQYNNTVEDQIDQSSTVSASGASDFQAQLMAALKKKNQKNQPNEDIPEQFAPQTQNNQPQQQQNMPQRTASRFIQPLEDLSDIPPPKQIQKPVQQTQPKPQEQPQIRMAESIINTQRAPSYFQNNKGAASLFEDDEDEPDDKLFVSKKKDKFANILTQNDPAPPQTYKQVVVVDDSDPEEQIPKQKIQTQQPQQQPNTQKSTSNVQPRASNAPQRKMPTLFDETEDEDTHKKTNQIASMYKQQDSPKQQQAIQKSVQPTQTQQKPIQVAKPTVIKKGGLFDDNSDEDDTMFKKQQQKPIIAQIKPQQTVQTSQKQQPQEVIKVKEEEPIQIVQAKLDIKSKPRTMIESDDDEQPQQNIIEKSVVKLQEKLVEKQVEKQVEQQVEKQLEKSAEHQVEKPVLTLADDVAEKPAEKQLTRVQRMIEEKQHPKQVEQHSEPPQRKSVQSANIAAIQQKLGLNADMFGKPKDGQVTKQLEKNQFEEKNQSDQIEQIMERPIIAAKKPRARRGGQSNFEEENPQQLLSESGIFSDAKLEPQVQVQTQVQNQPIQRTSTLPQSRISSQPMNFDDDEGKPVINQPIQRTQTSVPQSRVSQKPISFEDDEDQAPKVQSQSRTSTQPQSRVSSKFEDDEDRSSQSMVKPIQKQVVAQTLPTIVESQKEVPKAQESNLPKLGDDPLQKKRRDPLQAQASTKTDLVNKGFPNIFDNPLAGGKKKVNEPPQPQSKFSAPVDAGFKPQRRNLFEDEDEDDNPKMKTSQIKVQAKVQEPQAPSRAPSKPEAKRNMFEDDDEDSSPIPKPNNQSQQNTVPQMQTSTSRPQTQPQMPQSQNKPSQPPQKNMKSMFDDSDDDSKLPAKLNVQKQATQQANLPTIQAQSKPLIQQQQVAQVQPQQQQQQPQQKQQLKAVPIQQIQSSNQQNDRKSRLNKALFDDSD